MADSKNIAVHWPVGGIVHRYAYQAQGAKSTPDAENVRSDSAAVPSGAVQADYIRERGGSRPGLSKAFTEQLAGTAGSVAVCCSGVTLPSTATMAIYLNSTVFATFSVSVTQPVTTAAPDSFRYIGSHSTLFSTMRFSTATTVSVAASYTLQCPGPFGSSSPFANFPFFQSAGNSPVPDSIGIVANCSPVMVTAVNPYFPEWRWEVNQ